MYEELYEEIIEDEIRCEADAKVGTGTGVCLRVIDRNGSCGNESNHVR